MSKYIILIVVAAIAFVHIRMTSNNIAKAMYNEGCSDVVLKLKTIGEIQDADLMTKFCVYRKKSLDDHFGVF